MCVALIEDLSGVAQWERVWLITKRSKDRNFSPLYFLLKILFGSLKILFGSVKILFVSCPQSQC